MGATIEALAEAIAGFHERAEERPERGGYAGMREVIEGNAEDLTGLADAVLRRSSGRRS